MGNLDRILRISASVVIAVLIYTKVLTGVLATVGMVLIGIFVVTSLIAFCPLYLPLGLNTGAK